MVTTGTGTQRGMKQPEEILCSQFPSLNVRSFFRSDMLGYEFQISKNSLELKLSSIRKLFEDSIDSGRIDSQKLRDQFESQVVDTIRNNCSNELLNLHGRQLALCDTEKRAFDFLSSLFAQETEDEKREKARDELENLVRRSEKGEKFAAFLKRIKSVALIVSDKADVQNHMVDNHFSQNIEPANRAFLRDHGVAKKSSEDQADFLDQRERHLVANISALEASKMDSFVARTQKLLDNTLEKVNETIAAHSYKNKDDLEKENLELKEKLDNLTAAVAKIEINKSNNSQNQNFAPRPFFNNQPNFAPRPAFNAPPNFAPRFSSPAQRFPGQFFPQNNQNSMIICRFCNSPGHTKPRCPYVTCYKCSQRGHLARDCQNQARQGQQPQQAQNQQAQNPQNSLN